MESRTQVVPRGRGFSRGLLFVIEGDSVKEDLGIQGYGLRRQGPGFRYRSTRAPEFEVIETGQPEVAATIRKQNDDVSSSLPHALGEKTGTPLQPTRKDRSTSKQTNAGTQPATIVYTHFRFPEDGFKQKDPPRRHSDTARQEDTNTLRTDKTQVLLNASPQENFAECKYPPVRSIYAEPELGANRSQTASLGVMDSTTGHQSDRPASRPGTSPELALRHMKKSLTDSGHITLKMPSSVCLASSSTTQAQQNFSHSPKLYKGFRNYSCPLVSPVLDLQNKTSMAVDAGRKSLVGTATCRESTSADSNTFLTFRAHNACHQPPRHGEKTLSIPTTATISSLPKQHILGKTKSVNGDYVVSREKVATRRTRYHNHQMLSQNTKSDTDTAKEDARTLRENTQLNFSGCGGHSSEGGQPSSGEISAPLIRLMAPSHLDQHDASAPSLDVAPSHVNLKTKNKVKATGNWSGSSCPPDVVMDTLIRQDGTSQLKAQHPSLTHRGRDKESVNNVLVSDGPLNEDSQQDSGSERHFSNMLSQDDINNDEANDRVFNITEFPLESQSHSGLHDKVSFLDSSDNEDIVTRNNNLLASTRAAVPSYIKTPNKISPGEVTADATYRQLKQSWGRGASADRGQMSERSKPDVVADVKSGVSSDVSKLDILSTVNNSSMTNTVNFDLTPDASSKQRADASTGDVTDICHPPEDLSANSKSHDLPTDETNVSESFPHHSAFRAGPSSASVVDKYRYCDSRASPRVVTGTKMLSKPRVNTTEEGEGHVHGSVRFAMPARSAPGSRSSSRGDWIVCRDYRSTTNSEYGGRHNVWTRDNLNSCIDTEVGRGETVSTDEEEVVHQESEDRVREPGTSGDGRKMMDSISRREGRKKLSSTDNRQFLINEFTSHHRMPVWSTMKSSADSKVISSPFEHEHFLLMPGPLNPINKDHRKTSNQTYGDEITNTQHGNQLDGSGEELDHGPFSLTQIGGSKTVSLASTISRKLSELSHVRCKQASYPGNRFLGNRVVRKEIHPNSPISRELMFSNRRGGQRQTFTNGTTYRESNRMEPWNQQAARRAALRPVCVHGCFTIETDDKWSRQDASIFKNHPISDFEFRPVSREQPVGHEGGAGNLGNITVSQDNGLHTGPASSRAREGTSSSGIQEPSSEILDYIWSYQGMGRQLLTFQSGDATVNQGIQAGKLLEMFEKYGRLPPIEQPKPADASETSGLPTAIPTMKYTNQGGWVVTMETTPSEERMASYRGRVRIDNSPEASLEEAGTDTMRAAGGLTQGEGSRRRQLVVKVPTAGDGDESAK